MESAGNLSNVLLRHMSVGKNILKPLLQINPSLPSSLKLGPMGHGGNTLIVTPPTEPGTDIKLYFCLSLYSITWNQVCLLSLCIMTLTQRFNQIDA